MKIGRIHTQGFCIKPDFFLGGGGGGGGEQALPIGGPVAPLTPMVPAPCTELDRLIISYIM